MATQSTAAQREESLVSLPTSPVGYVALLAAVVTGGAHLLLGVQVLGFSQTMGVLFLLNGLGFLGGSLLYVSRYWRPELYLVAAGYAVVTILAFFAVQGVGPGAFYTRAGDLNPLAVVSKAAELVLAVLAVYRYQE
ncbi:MAG: hypothetical protein V5A61_14415 [Haloarculaceae archaeon]